MNEDERYSKIIEAREDIAQAWAHAPGGYDTWVEVDNDGVVTTSHQTTSTTPHPENEDYVMALPYIYDVAEENDDGEGYCHPDALLEDIEKEAERALLSDDE